MKGSSNGQAGSKSEREIELSVEGVDVPEDAVLDDGVIVAALSLAANLPLTLGWSIHKLLGARMLVGAGDDAVDNIENTHETQAAFGDNRPWKTLDVRCWTV